MVDKYDMKIVNKEQEGKRAREREISNCLCDNRQKLYYNHKRDAH